MRHNPEECCFCMNKEAYTSSPPMDSEKIKAISKQVRTRCKPLADHTAEAASASHLSSIIDGVPPPDSMAANMLAFVGLLFQMGVIAFKDPTPPKGGDK